MENRIRCGHKLHHRALLPLPPDHLRHAVRLQDEEVSGRLQRDQVHPLHQLHQHDPLARLRAPLHGLHQPRDRSNTTDPGPTQVSTDHKIRAVILAYSLSLSGIVQLGCLIFPKLYTVLFKVTTSVLLYMICPLAAREEHEGGGDAPQVPLLRALHPQRHHLRHHLQGPHGGAPQLHPSHPPQGEYYLPTNISNTSPASR